MTNKRTKNLTEKEETVEIKLSEFEMLKKRLSELEQKRNESNEIEDNNIDENIDERIQQDDYISVMSLIPYNLNLSTKEKGQGNIKKFTKFGEVKRILYRDLVDIMEVNTKFMKAGYFYILDNRVIRQHGLDDVYSKILTKEKIEEILSTGSDNSIELYKIANEEQQKVIIGLLIEKIRENPDSVNLNMIDKISRLSGVDILEKAEDVKQLWEVMTEDKESENK